MFSVRLARALYGDWQNCALGLSSAAVLFRSRGLRPARLGRLSGHHDRSTQQAVSLSSAPVAGRRFRQGTVLTLRRRPDPRSVASARALSAITPRRAFQSSGYLPGPGFRRVVQMRLTGPRVLQSVLSTFILPIEKPPQEAAWFRIPCADSLALLDCLFRPAHLRLLARRRRRLIIPGYEVKRR